jgi:hypothetical protein
LLGASASLLPRVAFAANGTIPGAIRWDPWYGTTSAAALSTGPAELQAPQWQFRAPWFATPQRGGLLINGNQQATIDAEIGYAASAGLKYWAYVWYGDIVPLDGMMNAWTLHQSSSIRNSMNWCLMLQFSEVSPTTFANDQAQYVAYFQQSNYQLVLTNRPLVYLLIDDLNMLTTRWGSDWANVKAALDALRTATVAAGLGTPYIVIMYGVPANAASYASQTGSDAISNYLLGSNQLAELWQTYEPTVEAFWAAMGATGTPIVPDAQTGWDQRPRLAPQFVNACTVRLSDFAYVVVPTGPQLTAHLQAAVSYVVANPTQCPSKAILIYSWDECSEGGNAIIPTYGNGSGPDTGRITALQGVTW